MNVYYVSELSHEWSTTKILVLYQQGARDADGAYMSARLRASTVNRRVAMGCAQSHKRGNIPKEGAMAMTPELRSPYMC